MNIRLYKTNPFGFQTRKTKLQRRFAINCHHFLRKCIDLINHYEVIQTNYKQLFNEGTLSVISETIYRERFSKILLLNKELMDAYGKNVDQFINCSLDIWNLSKVDKKHFEHIMGLYLMMKKEYLLMEKLFSLPFLIEELPPDNTSLVNIPAESIKRYTGR